MNVKKPFPLIFISFLLVIGVIMHAVTSNADNTSDPIVIFATGQSNFGFVRNNTWEGADNLYQWNYQKNTNTTGTQFQSLAGIQNTSIVPQLFANKIALANPNTDVYLISISWGGQSIDRWLQSDVSSSSMYSITRNNVQSALNNIGVDKVDMFLWWQGEADTSTVAIYKDRWNEVEQAYVSEPWFTEETPTFIFGVNTSTPPSIAPNGNYDSMANTLSSIAAERPAYRSYIFTGNLTFPDKIHLSAEGQLTVVNRAYSVYATKYSNSGLSLGRLFVGGVNNQITESSSLLLLGNKFGVNTSNPKESLSIRGKLQLQSALAYSMSGDPVNNYDTVDIFAAPHTINQNAGISIHQQGAKGYARKTIRLAYKTNQAGAGRGTIDIINRNSFNAIVSNVEAITIKTNGNLGVGRLEPKTRLDVNGSIKIANGNEVCDTLTAGVIRFHSGVHQGCNGASWKDLY